MTNPLKVMIITSSYQDHIKAGGVRAANPGTDFRAKLQPCYAVESGSVTCGTDKYGAKWVFLYSMDKRRVWRYVHLDSWWVASGQIVREGQQVGVTGNTGLGASYHLHLGLKVNNKWVDPMILLNRNNDMTFNELLFRAVSIQRPDVVKQYPTVDRVAYWWSEWGFSEWIKWCTQQKRTDLVKKFKDDKEGAKLQYATYFLYEMASEWGGDPAKVNEKKLQDIEKIVKS